MCNDALVCITYFVPDKLKSGGSYETVTGTIKRIDEYERIVILTEGMIIPIDNIYQIDGDMFNSEDFIW